MASENSVTLVGNLTRDPELRYTTGGRGVASYGLANNTCSFTPSINTLSGLVTWTCGDSVETCTVDVTATDDGVPPATGSGKSRSMGGVGKVRSTLRPRSRRPWRWPVDGRRSTPIRFAAIW